MKKYHLFLFLIFLQLFAVSQTYKSRITPALKYLFESKYAIDQITQTESIYIFPVEIDNNIFKKFNVIKNTKGLFVLLNGTGRVYKASKADSAFIYFERVDSTVFYGNSFNSIDFSFNDIIYSLGGYGFWHFNGQLRQFRQGKDWVIKKLNLNIQTQSLSEFIDSKDSSIYYIQYPFINEEDNSKKEKFGVYKLSINKQIITKLGNLNEKISKEWDLGINIPVPSLEGTLIVIKKEIYLLNYKKNKVFKLKHGSLHDMICNDLLSSANLTFAIEDKLYYSTGPFADIFSVPISINDFTEEPYPVFKEIKFFENNLEVTIFILIISILIMFVIKTYYLNPKKKEEIEIKNTDLSSIEFNSTERHLISKLIEKSNIDSFLTVEDFNIYLGIKKKPIEIQKRVRNEFINRVNHKFNMNFNLQTVFIERVKANEDKRYTNYLISKDNIKIYFSFIK
jgi:hypothetical protein